MIGDRLKLLRKTNNLSQQSLAKILSTSSGYISEIERGLKTPGSEFLLTLKRELGVNVDWMLTGEGDQFADQTLGGQITVDHICIVKSFKNKEEAMQISKILREIESIDERQFFRILGRLEIELEKIKNEAIPDDNNSDRRKGQRRIRKDPESIPGGKDRRSGRDRRKAAGGNH